MSKNDALPSMKIGWRISNMYSVPSGVAKGTAGKVTKVSLTPAMALNRSLLCRANSEDEVIRRQAVRALCLGRNEDTIPFMRQLIELIDQSNLDDEEREGIAHKFVECLGKLADSGSSNHLELHEYEALLKNMKRPLDIILAAMHAYDEGRITSGCHYFEVSYICAASPCQHEKE